MRAGFTAILATAALWVAGYATAQSPAFEPATREASVLTQARRVADWQLAHMDTFAGVSTFRDHTADPIDWIQATFYAGLADLADATGDAAYAQAVIAHGEAAGWGFQDRPRHADADAIGHAWVWSAARAEGEERVRRLAPIRARFDAVAATPSDVSMIFDEKGGERACQVRWCWSDAVFMAPPVWTALSKLTGDPRYTAHADRELKVTIATLYDADAHLFYRDSRFIGRLDDQGRKIFWSRGNGWSYAGLARVLATLPSDHPSRTAYETVFRQMSDALIASQGTEGYWPVSLLDPVSPPETSGTAFFVYGLAWGVNAGLLDKAAYGPAVARGWTALDQAIQPDGRLGWVQQVGYAPDRVSAEDTQLYGVGAYLMAASEISRQTNW